MLAFAVDGFSNADNSSLTCSRPAGSKDRCTITWSCAACYPTVSNATLLLNVSDPNAWAAQIRWGLTSSIPNHEPSTVLGELNPSQGLIFHGAPFPRLVVTTTRVRYQYYSDPPVEGAMVNFESFLRGNQLGVDQFGDGQFCGLQVNINVSPSVLAVRVIVRQSYLAMVANIISLITGILAGSRLLLSKLLARQMRKQPSGTSAFRIVRDY